VLIEGDSLVSFVIFRVNPRLKTSALPAPSLHGESDNFVTFQQSDLHCRSTLFRRITLRSGGVEPHADEYAHQTNPPFQLPRKLFARLHPSS
jgi:hypothetical protein